MGVQFIPHSRQNFTIQILEARHWRRRFGQGGPFRIRWFRDADGCGVLEIGIMAKRGEEPLGKPTPENKAGRQRIMQKRGRQHFQSTRGRGGESLGQTRSGDLAEFRFSQFVRLDKEMSAGR